jgi:hypothetical protein
VDTSGRRSRSYTDPVAATAQFSWPPARKFMTIYAQNLMAADTLAADPVNEPASATPPQPRAGGSPRCPLTSGGPVRATQRAGHHQRLGTLSPL